ESGWVRLVTTFRVETHGRVDVAVGFSPDLASSVPGATVLLRHPQLEVGDVATQYETSVPPTEGVGEAVARLTHWQSAWSGIREAPIVGRGTGSFRAYYQSHASAYDARHDPPDHPHNQFLTSAFEGGLLGVLALMLLV